MLRNSEDLFVSDPFLQVKFFPTCRFNQLQDTSAQCGFTATAFTYHPNNIALVYCKTYIINCVKKLSCFAKKIFLSSEIALMFNF